eukprot:6571938-Prymnesium_polylepis.1
MRHRTCGRHRGCDTGRAGATQDVRGRHRTCGGDTGRMRATRAVCESHRRVLEFWRVLECWRAVSAWRAGAQL